MITCYTAQRKKAARAGKKRTRKGGGDVKINTKCSVAIHILLVIAVFSDSDTMTSEKIAASTGNSPVIVRTLLGSLKRAGLVHVQRGRGGATLARTPAEISVWDIYRAVDPTSLANLIGIHPHPSEICPVGQRINDVLAEPYDAIKAALQKSMSDYTLADAVRRYHLSAAQDSP